MPPQATLLHRPRWSPWQTGWRWPPQWPNEAEALYVHDGAPGGEAVITCQHCGSEFDIRGLTPQESRRKYRLYRFVVVPLLVVAMLVCFQVSMLLATQLGGAGMAVIAGLLVVTLSLGVLGLYRYMGDPPTYSLRLVSDSVRPPLGVSHTVDLKT